MPADLNAPHEIVDVRDPVCKNVMLQGAIESHVLVKDTHQVLPLQKPKLTSFFGYDSIAASPE